MSGTGMDDRARFLSLSAPLLRKFSADPSIPTELDSVSLAEILETAAPFLLAIFGSPEAAVAVVDDSLGRLFAKLEDVQQSLDRIEKSIRDLEAKHDATVLARFKSGLQELRAGLRARRKPFREQVLLNARTKLTELCELPPGLSYGPFPSHGIAAAACLLVAMIDTWYGEFESAHRYNLRSLVADPLMADGFLGKDFIDALAGPELRRMEEEQQTQIEAERVRVHDFFWNKVGVGAIAAVGVILNPGGSGVHIANAGRAMASYDTQDTQEKARSEAIEKILAQASERRATLLRTLASERLRAIE